MKVLFYRYGSICEPDIIEAFKELGLTMAQFNEEITNKSLTAKECITILSSYLLDHPTDFLFSINFFPAVSEVCNIFHIPYLCWIVDSPVMELYTSSIQNPWNRVFLFDKCIYEEIAPLNPDCVFYLPLATNVRQKQELITKTQAEAADYYRNDVSFLGSLYTEKCAYDRLEHAPDYLTGYLNGIMEAQLKVYGYYFIENVLPDAVVTGFVDHFPGFYRQPGETFLTDRTTLAQLYIGTKITVLERDRTMRRLSERFPLSIYTGSDTSAYPKLRNRGMAKTLTEMPLIFRHSIINLNITAKSIRSGLSLRIWDILASGGFCLTNYQPELPELLTIGAHLDAYTSMEELEEKVQFYLEHPARAREIAENGLREIESHHTYPIRLTRMLELAFTGR